MSHTIVLVLSQLLSRSLAAWILAHHRTQGKFHVVQFVGGVENNSCQKWLLVDTHSVFIYIYKLVLILFLFITSKVLHNKCINIHATTEAM